MQVDSQRIKFLAEDLASVARLPVQLIFCLTYLFIAFGVSFFAGLGVMIFTIAISYYQAKLTLRFQKVVMAKKDKRMAATTEALNNIKTLKFCAWTDMYKLSTKTVATITSVVMAIVLVR